MSHGQYQVLYSTWLVFLCSSRGLNYIHPANYQLSEKLQLSSHLVRTLGSPSQFTYICAGLSPPLNVESNRSWCWQSLLSTLGGGTATSVPTNVTAIVGAALIVKGECGAETIADYNSKTMEYIPLNIFHLPYSPRLSCKL